MPIARIFVSKVNATLLSNCGKQRTEQVHDLLFVPGIHITQENDDIEVCEAFLIELRPATGKEFVSRN